MSLLTPPQGGNDILRGIGFMCFGVCLFPFQNATMKYLSGYYPLPELMWVRFTGHFLLILLMFWPQRGWRLLRTTRPLLQGGRSLLMLGAVVFYVWGLSYMPLATAASIAFTAPILVTAFSVPLLGEHVGWRRWTAVLIGFGGALIIIRPGSGDMHWAVGLLLLNVTCYALYQILTRKVALTDSAETSIAYTALAGAVVLTVVVPFVWQTPVEAKHWVLFGVLGVLGGISHFFVIRAFQFGAVAVIAPLGYLELIGATILGYLIFGNLPDRWTYVGAAVIAASGIFIAYREATLARRPPRS
jgi:drug/metabolite transporter (DMT)-like permease